MFLFLYVSLPEVKGCLMCLQFWLKQHAAHSQLAMCVSRSLDHTCKRRLQPNTLMNPVESIFQHAIFWGLTTPSQQYVVDNCINTTD